MLFYYELHQARSADLLREAERERRVNAVRAARRRARKESASASVVPAGRVPEQDEEEVPAGSIPRPRRSASIRR